MAEKQGAGEGFEAVRADDGVEGVGLARGFDCGGLEVYAADCGVKVDCDAKVTCFID